MSRWARGVALSGAVLVIVVPACSERWISLGKDSNEPIAPGDDDPDDGGGPLGGRGGTSGMVQGGIGADGNTGGDRNPGGEGSTGDDGVMGGSFSMGGAVPIAGAPAGGSPSNGGVGGTVPVGGTTPTGGIAGTIPMGGTTPTGGIGGAVPMGGTTPAGGAMMTGGSSTGGFAGADGTGGVNTELQCRGIRSNMPCAAEGYMCPNLACGLADSGRRTCACATTWTCTSCDFSNSPFRDRPANIDACSPDVADEVACFEQNTVCGPSVGGEYCACYLSPTDGLIWDCDSPPSTWTD